MRKAGGRAAAYHQGTLVVDHIEPHADAIAGSKTRFGFFGELLAQALRGAGVEAAVGEIPGEYCPGEFSVHGTDPADPAHQVKLVGTAQRVVSGGWLFSSVIVVENSRPIRGVLTASYAALGLDWDPATAGAVMTSCRAWTSRPSRTPWWHLRRLRAPGVRGVQQPAALAAGT